MSNKPSRSPRRYRLLISVAASLAALPVLVVLWFITALQINLRNGGTLGGIAAAPAEPEPWVTPLITLLLALTLAADAAIGVYVYRSRRG